MDQVAKGAGTCTRGFGGRIGIDRLLTASGFTTLANDFRSARDSVRHGLCRLEIGKCVTSIRSFLGLHQFEQDGRAALYN